MTSLNVDLVTAPFEDTLYPMLRNHQDAALYLFDAFEDKKDRHAIFNALKDIILANKTQWTLPFLCVYFSIHKLNANKIEDIIDFMEENLEPEVRAFMTNIGAIPSLRAIVREYRKRGKNIKINLNISFSNKLGLGNGMNNAQQALQKALAESSNEQIFNDLQKVLAP